MRLFMSLTEEEVKQFDKACDKAGMTRSQYLKCLLMEGVISDRQYYSTEK